MSQSKHVSLLMEFEEIVRSSKDMIAMGSCEREFAQFVRKEAVVAREYEQALKQVKALQRTAGEYKEWMECADKKAAVVRGLIDREKRKRKAAERRRAELLEKLRRVKDIVRQDEALRTFLEEPTLEAGLECDAREVAATTTVTIQADGPFDARVSLTSCMQPADSPRGSSSDGHGRCDVCGDEVMVAGSPEVYGGECLKSTSTCTSSPAVAVCDGETSAGDEEEVVWSLKDMPELSDEDVRVIEELLQRAGGPVVGAAAAAALAAAAEVSDAQHSEQHFREELRLLSSSSREILADLAQLLRAACERVPCPGARLERLAKVLGPVVVAGIDTSSRVTVLALAVSLPRHFWLLQAGESSRSDSGGSTYTTAPSTAACASRRQTTH
ncbi:hypothetical protein PR048_008814 [Dryococelus australis]|uniref:Uncharacterized protein n=1 Tax=Dryococelus australis TaxID=614101 RepID=A0ABQ9HZ72_9NEOP|nr:hypothetical protein PR048_008814 [Dryococelus australis]